MNLTLTQTTELRCYSKSTEKAYAFHIDKFRSYYQNPQQENIIHHLLYLKRKGYQASSLSVARAAIIFYFENILKQKISINIDKPKRKKTLPRPVNREVIVALIQNTSNLKHRIVIEMLYSTGLRLSELVKIKWEHIDFLNKTLFVEQGKGCKDRYTILSDVVIQHLLDYQQQRANKNNPYVLDSLARPNTHISKKTVQKILENSAKRANLNIKVSPHQIRHSFATHSLENGTDIRHIQELLGHSSPKTTMIYTKVTKQNLSKLQSPMDKLDLTIQKDVKTNKEDCVEVAVISNTRHNS